MLVAAMAPVAMELSVWRYLVRALVVAWDDTGAGGVEIVISGYPGTLLHSNISCR